jgi:hypothetical protein
LLFLFSIFKPSACCYLIIIPHPQIKSNPISENIAEGILKITVTINKNPFPHLCTRENRHEQTVNFSENHEHFFKNVGSKVEGYFHGQSGRANI